MRQRVNEPIRNLPVVTAPRAGQGSAATWQIVLTVFGLVAIVAIFFWGINNQRDETAGEQTAATMPAPATPQAADAQKGQGQAEGQQADQRTQPSTTGQGGDQNGQQHSAEKASGQPADNNGEPPQRQSK
jgi:hypothetical protein